MQLLWGKFSKNEKKKDFFIRNYYTVTVLNKKNPLDISLEVKSVQRSYISCRGHRENFEYKIST